MADSSSILTEAHRFKDRFPNLPDASNYDMCDDFDEDAVIIERQVLSLDSLLNSDDAAGILISFLELDEESYDTTILWLTTEFCISCNPNLEEDQWTCQEHGFGSLVFFSYEYDKTSDESQKGSGCFTLYKLPNGESSESPVAVMDTMLRVFAKSKRFSSVTVSNHGFYAVPPETLSLQTLEAFVGQVHNSRVLGFSDLRFSNDQCRVLAFKCSKNIMLHVNLTDWSDGGASLIEAMNLNQGPSKIALVDTFGIPDESFNALVGALKTNASLEHFCLLSGCEPSGPFARNMNDGLFVPFSVDPHKDRRFQILIDAIARNRGIRLLDLEHLSFDVLVNQWGNFWNSISCHPTLTTVKIPCIEEPSIGKKNKHKHALKQQLATEKHLRDQVIARAICSNTVLSAISYKSQSRNQQIMDEQFRPILEFNGFRPLVQAIKEEQDLSLKSRLFASTLLHDQVRQGPESLYYLLLKENPDLVVQMLFSTTQMELLPCERTKQMLVRLDGLDTSNLKNWRGLPEDTPQERWAAKREGGKRTDNGIPSKKPKN